MVYFSIDRAFSSVLSCRRDPERISYGGFKSILPFLSSSGSHLDGRQREYAPVCDSDRDRAVGGKTSTALLFSPAPRLLPAFDSEQFAGGFCSARVLGRLTNFLSFRSKSSLLTSKPENLLFRIWGEGGLLERFKEVLLTSEASMIDWEPKTNQHPILRMSRRVGERQTEFRLVEHKKLCERCGVNEVYLDIKTMRLCEPCIWKLVQEQQ